LHARLDRSRQPRLTFEFRRDQHRPGS
jgi:hypothetical protein